MTQYSSVPFQAVCWNIPAIILSINIENNLNPLLVVKNYIYNNAIVMKVTGLDKHLIIPYKTHLCLHNIHT